MEMIRLLIVWLLVLIAYILINPPTGKARIVAKGELSEPHEINQEYLSKHYLNAGSFYRKNLIK